MNVVINIASQYSKFPAGRYPEDGEGNGTTFRVKFLVPNLRDKQDISVVLDGTAGYPSSFLEEAFGGLVRKEGFTREEVRSRIKFVALEPAFRRYLQIIDDFLTRAVPENQVGHG